MSQLSNTCIGCTDANVIEPTNLCGPTTTFAVTATPCVGTVTTTAHATYEVCCEPISIYPLEGQICAACPCFANGVEVSTLPTHGTLHVDGTLVAVNDILDLQANGTMIYTKTIGYVGADTFELVFKTQCGDSTPQVINVICNNVTCDAPAICATC
jgi:hypothetical protein